MNKYTAKVNHRGKCLVIDSESGKTVAYADDVGSLEWIVDELNTLNWALDRLLKKGTHCLDPSGKAPSRQAEGPQEPGTNSPQPVRPT